MQLPRAVHQVHEKKTCVYLRRKAYQNYVLETSSQQEVHMKARLKRSEYGGASKICAH